MARGLSQADRTAFRQGMIDGLPLLFAYITASFTFGLAAVKMGLSATEATVMAATNNASAGQLAGLTAIVAGASLLEVALTTIVVNSRYILMSCALTQKIDQSMSTPKRMLLAWSITDEIFGLDIRRKGKLNPYYNYGAMLVVLTGWAFGTLAGAVLGQLLPTRILNAFGIMLYAMLLAVIIPGAKMNKVIFGLVAASWASHYAFQNLPILKEIPTSVVVIILSVAITAIGAYFFPVPMEDADVAADVERGAPEDPLSRHHGHEHHGHRLHGHEYYGHEHHGHGQRGNEHSSDTQNHTGGQT